jgi:hypothetical protein
MAAAIIALAPALRTIWQPTFRFAAAYKLARQLLQATFSPTCDVYSCCTWRVRRCKNFFHSISKPKRTERLNVEQCSIFGKQPPAITSGTWDIQNFRTVQACQIFPPNIDKITNLYFGLHITSREIFISPNGLCTTAVFANNQLPQLLQKWQFAFVV